MSGELDYIIVGQGIAGSVISSLLIEKGENILVIDTPDKNISSNIAAGIFNPVTGRNNIKTWNAELLWPRMFAFYQNIEKKSKSSFFHHLEHYRPFRSTSETNDLISRTSNPSYDQFVKKVCHEPQFDDYIKNPVGGIMLKQSGYLDIPVFLSIVRKMIVEKGSFVKESFIYNDLDANSEQVCYHNYKARKIIFCDGWYPETNPFFENLPFKPVKGELLKIKSELPENWIFNRGVFALPKGNGISVIGSTYENSDLTSTATEKGRDYLTSKLKELLKIPFEVIDHYAGIRPATLDRRPFVGIHPKYETIAILNGLGTKGVSLAPYFAEELISFIDGKGKLDPEADIKRYL